MFTILGATGYIGSNLVKKLTAEGYNVYAPKRGENLKPINLGTVIYCIGLTADFRTKPFETVEAHVCLLNSILKKHQFQSLTYLSSTRVYINSKKTEVNEEDTIEVDVLNPEDLYTLTKLTGERICLSSGKPVKIARLSNIFGNDYNSENFLSSIIKKIKTEKALILQASLSSAKDYLHIEDAVNLLIQIALNGKEKIYNVASGFNTSNNAIINALKKENEFTTQLAENAKETVFPNISTAKIKKEFNFTPKEITTLISKL